MKLDISEQNGVTVIDGVPEKLDYTVCNAFQRTLAPYLDQGANKLLLNLDGVVFLDSCAIGTLITIRNRLLKTKGVLSLCALGEQIQKIIKITDLHKVFDIYDAKEEGVAAMSADQPA